MTELAQLRAENRRFREVLQALIECPITLDLATVPAAGIDACPEQVCLTISCGLLKFRALESALAATPETAREVRRAKVLEKIANSAKKWVGLPYVLDDALVEPLAELDRIEKEKP